MRAQPSRSAKVVQLLHPRLRQLITRLLREDYAHVLPQRAAERMLATERPLQLPGRDAQAQFAGGVGGESAGREQLGELLGCGAVEVVGSAHAPGVQ